MKSQMTPHLKWHTYQFKWIITRQCGLGKCTFEIAINDPNPISFGKPFIAIVQRQPKVRQQSSIISLSKASIFPQNFFMLNIHPGANPGQNDMQNHRDSRWLWTSVSLQCQTNSEYAQSVPRKIQYNLFVGHAINLQKVQPKCDE